MIKNIIYVEDGSIDVEELQECLGEDTKIIVYRQGAVKPVVEQLTTPIKTHFDDNEEKLRRETAKEIFKKAYALCTSAVNPEPAFHKFIQELKDEYGFEIEVEE